MPPRPTRRQAGGQPQDAYLPCLECEAAMVKTAVVLSRKTLLVFSVGIIGWLSILIIAVAENMQKAKAPVRSYRGIPVRVDTLTLRGPCLFLQIHLEVGRTSVTESRVQPAGVIESQKQF